MFVYRLLIFCISNPQDVFEMVADAQKEEMSKEILTRDKIGIIMNVVCIYIIGNKILESKEQLGKIMGTGQVS